MPSPGEDIQSWSTVAANNGTADPLIVWSEGQARASVNNSARSEMAAIAKHRNLNNGSIVTAGSANAQTFQSGVSYTSIPSGLRATLKVGSGLTNTTSMTLNMDGLGDTLVKTAADGTNLKGGEFVAGGYVDLLYNGTNWIFLYSREFLMDLINGGGGIIIGKQIFSAAGTFTYTPTSGMECCIIECCGGGGGGGAAQGIGNQFTAGSGGGSGGYSRKYATAAEIGGSQTITVGAAGNPNGGTGGTTSVGTLCIAFGGAGGSAAGTAGGAGGAPGTGDIVAAGAPGHGAVYNNNIGALFVMGASGAGGSSYFGGGAQGVVASSGGQSFGGVAASNYGSGGGGACVMSGVDRDGGPGSAGIVVITEFAGRGAPGHDGMNGPAGPVGPPGPAGAGTGDVLVFGTPTAGQLAQWQDTSHIKGVAVSSIVPSDFTTGDAKLTLKTVADTGWIIMDDGSIGSATSGSSTRANADTQALFTLLFNNITDTWAPILTSTGTATTRAAQVSAATAWANNCRMTLTRQLGRAITIAGAGAGLTSHVLGGYDGAETHTQTVAELVAHSHSIAGVTYGTPSGGANQSIVGGGTGDSGFFSPTSLSTEGAGGGAPFSIIQPRSFWNIMIKL